MILATTDVGDTTVDAPEIWFLHGILGSGRNWRGFARRLARELPGWRCVLVDLRCHGDSPTSPDGHTVAACADDLVETAAQRGQAPFAVVGHSFGGKVALDLAARSPDGLDVAVVLDSIPGALPEIDRDLAEAEGEVPAVLRALQRVPLPVPSYDDLVERLTGEGFSDGIARWMTTNLTPTEGGYTWRFDLSAMPDLLRDYAARDLWPTLFPPAVDTHLVRAGRSDRWTAAESAQLARFGEQTGAWVHVLEDAGHWVHVDAPDAVRAIVSRAVTGE